MAVTFCEQAGAFRHGVRAALTVCSGRRGRASGMCVSNQSQELPRLPGHAWKTTAVGGNFKGGMFTGRERPVVVSGIATHAQSSAFWKHSGPF